MWVRRADTAHFGKLQTISTGWSTLCGYPGRVRSSIGYRIRAADLSACEANLQVPYLLNIAVLAVEYLPLFDPSTRSVRASLRLFSKLDYVFSSLLTGHNSTNGESLPGFELGRCVSTTDKVRLKGIVDRTRLIVVRVMSEERADGDESGVGEPVDEDGEGEDAVAAGAPESTVSFEGFENTADDSAEDDDWEGHEVASVYEKTIGQLGDVLGGPPIGIITEDWDAIGTESQRDVQGFGAKE